MPAKTLGSWEAMTSDIISGNSTFMASAWMKVLRQNRLTFFTICREIERVCLCWCSTDRQTDANEQFCSGAYIVHGVHQFGEVVEALGAGHHAPLPRVDSLGQLPDVVLPHFLECSLTFESFKRH